MIMLELFNGTLALGLTLLGMEFSADGANKAGKDSSCGRTWATGCFRNLSGSATIYAQ